MIETHRMQCDSITQCRRMRGRGGGASGEREGMKRPPARGGRGEEQLLVSGIVVETVEIRILDFRSFNDHRS